MRRSDNFIEVFKGIEKARPLFKSLKKESKNPHFKSEYADLDEVLHAIKDGLHSANIAVSQFPNHKDDGRFVLTTIVSHTESGAFIESDYHLLVDKATSQAQGSAITYARRYSLTAIFGLYEFDDDGNEASKQSVVQKSPEVTNKEELQRVMKNIRNDYDPTPEQWKEIAAKFLQNYVSDKDLPLLVRKEFERLKVKRKSHEVKRDNEAPNDDQQ